MDGHSPIDNQAIEPKGKPTKARKPKSSDKATGKRSLNLSLPVDDYKRLATHALMQDINISDLVCKLAREHLREFHITRTPSREAS
jgi:hypothetical protein